MDRQKLIEVNNVSFSYAETPVLRGITFDVKEGDFVALLGSNGAGKSTLLKLLLAELSPKSGTINLFSDDITRFKAWHQIQYIAQKNEDFNPDFPASVLEVVTANLYPFARKLLPFSKKDITKAYEALALCDIEHLAKRRIGELSGGQMQRVFLARALIHDAKLLIMDEATSGIDSHSEHLIYDLLQSLRKSRGLTVLMVTHDLSAARQHASRLLALNQRGVFEYPVEAAMEQSFLGELFGIVPQTRGGL